MFAAGVLGTAHRLNPLSALFQATRAAAGGGPIAGGTFLASALVAAALVAGGWMLCRFCLPHVAERSVT